ncbi:hypothetical protein ACRRTK_016841 [Alexandromys fortis]
MMKPTDSCFSGYHMCFTLLMQVIALPSTSQNLMVTTPTGHLVARVGGQAELSCQVYPPRSVESMEVRWLRSDNYKLVYQYRGGHHGVNGEAAPEYANRTEFVKEAIGKGRVALRIHNIRISDEGPYRCLFNDSGFGDVVRMYLSVAAFGLKTQIHIESSAYDGPSVDCVTEGWFPQPRMEWRDSQGEVVPYSSISYSQDEDRFFRIKMTLLLRNQSQKSITCCVLNPLTGEEKQTNLILPCKYSNMRGHESGCKKELNKLDIASMILQFLCFIAFSGAIVYKYLQLRNKVSISDPLFSLYNSWMADMAFVVAFLVGTFSITTIALLWKHIKSK